jgi:hypothetical protein
MSESQHTPARWEKLGHTTLARTVVFELQNVRYRQRWMTASLFANERSAPP